MIDQAQCGVSANSADLQACITALKTLLNNEAEFTEIGARGRGYAIENFSKEACVTQIATMLAAA